MQPECTGTPATGEAPGIPIYEALGNADGSCTVVVHRGHLHRSKVRAVEGGLAQLVAPGDARLFRLGWSDVRAFREGQELPDVLLRFVDRAAGVVGVSVELQAGDELEVPVIDQQANVCQPRDWLRCRGAS